MPQIMVDLPFEKIVATVKKLSEEEQEKLLFAINNDYAKALGKMRDEAWKGHREGKSIPLESLE
ncbi:MAG: hypothetical protein JRC57_03035 [Deltaproteobacteria bacterium]|jgi:hypothetical protein|nr:hypothetical protein [Deltaproteobacteria bacterium]MBW2652050.1 hypothetical protein [Deltaproteobacteria bacterium]MCK5187081.1 hypothetical protein [Deltaproteobacteria bacterium]